MLLSLIVTVFVVLILVWLAFMAIDMIMAGQPPRPSPTFPLGTLLKALVAIAAIVVICEAAFGAHRLLIHISGI